MAPLGRTRLQQQYTANLGNSTIFETKQKSARGRNYSHIYPPTPIYAAIQNPQLRRQLLENAQTKLSLKRVGVILNWQVTTDRGEFSIYICKDVSNVGFDEELARP
jgi:hypothetical protein